ncbi:hypothetical protein MHN80_14905 [Gordonia McavH-238-E]|uniref:hypothetical protein n=1 Tax=Gordonia TaxID=2053 RepID=UPI001EF45665|nr:MULTISPECIES: hypothetical protein [Gordonia]MCG7633603.1 hypothetical protein [Gordonia sp. McavH-238-E]UPW07558.1 hypothetical protein M1C59_15935 [Gordonia terrae]
MTVYSTEPGQLFATIRDTLAHRVAGHLTDTTARLELAAVIEALDNLADRIDWDTERLSRCIAETDDLARQLELGHDVSGAGVEGLRQRRRAISTALASTYRNDGASAKTVDAVLRFTEVDVREQISTALRNGLPD